MNAEEILKAVIDKYELGEPVPSNVRAAMEKSRKENLVRILKGNRRSALFISAVVSFFLWVKKFGISISIVKSAAVVSAALIIGAGVITTSGVYTFRKVIDKTAPKIEKTVSEEIIKTDVPPVKDIEVYTIAVSAVEMDDVSDNLLYEYRKKIIIELRGILGERAAINLERLDKFHTADKILSISVIRLNDQKQKSAAESVYRISAKVISNADSKVLLHTSVTSENENGIQDSLHILADKICAELKNN